MGLPRASIWEAPSPSPEAHLLAARLGLHPLMGAFLVNRGLRDVGAALEFLRVQRAPDPWLLRGVKEAAWRMLRAARRRDRVVVYGDYDADGQSSTAILVRALRRVGADVRAFIPHRLSLGYGLHKDVLLEMADGGVGLVVAVDCGLTAVSAIRRAKERGLDVIVVDHHEPGSRLPPAAAVVAAHRLAGWPGGPEMSAAGLAYHTARALLDLGGVGEEDGALLQLAAIGTVADVVSLKGENRRLVREGLQALRRDPLPGVVAISEQAGIDLASVDTYHLAFILAPRLNAAGRVDDAAVGLSVLLADSVDGAREAARRLELANRLRQSTEQAVLQQAMEQTREEVARRDPPVVVAVGSGWHPGVIGIVAARLVEAFARPAVVISVEGEEARGSARSVPGVDIHGALSECSHLFTRFGGHPMAAGFSMPAAYVPALAPLLEQAVAGRFTGPFDRVLQLDGWVRLDDLSGQLAAQLALLEPHGEGNPRPLLGAARLELVEVRPVGQDGRHLRFSLRECETGVERGAIAFGRSEAWGPELAALAGRQPVDVAFSVQPGRFGELEMHIVDLRPSSRPSLRLVAAPEPAGPVPGMTAGLRRAGPDGPDPEVVDARGLADEGPAALARWLCQRLGPESACGRSVVVAVRTREAALSLAAALWQVGGGEGLVASWGDRATLDKARRLAKSLFDDAGMLVSWDPGAVPACGPAVRHLVFWELPRTPVGWVEAARAASVRQVVLAYGRAEVERPVGGQELEVADRDRLARIFRLLVAHVRLAGPDLPPSGQLTRMLSMLEPGTQDLSPAMLAWALRVFEELGMARRQDGQGWRWIGTPAAKLDLTHSPLYNEAARERAYWVAYARRALELQAHAVWLDWVSSRAVDEERG